MKSISLLIFFTTLQLYSFSQKNGESTIGVKLNDTAMIYDRIVNAFAKTGFTMKDEYIKDTLTTKAKSIFHPSGYAVMRAVINGNNVIFNGWYKQQQWGAMYESDKENPNLKNYIRITYFNLSGTWNLMSKVAENLKKENIKSENIQPNVVKRSKEVRLRELKDLFEKELITKEEYEKSKQKILDEN